MYIHIVAIPVVTFVITIVVLIILATVVINLSLGNNGIFNKAKYASQSYKNAQDYEEEEIAKFANQVDNYYAGATRNGIPVTIDGEEHEIGTFFNKKIYQKCYTGKTTSNNYSLNVANLNIDKCLNIWGAIECDLGFMPIGYSKSDYVTAYYHKNNKTIEYRADSQYSKVDYILVIEYTKTID